MDNQSPPKRITRARAAAKTLDTAPKTTKIATAASKAKVTRSASTIKRKTRDDEEQNEPEDELIQPELPKTTRGRPKRAAAVQQDLELEMEGQVPAPVRSSRGRPQKKTGEFPEPEPTKSTRARAKKVDVSQDEPTMIVEEPPKKYTRNRATTISKTTAQKKNVTFEEPDKENIVPPPLSAAGNEKATEIGTGLKAKPVRKPAATTTRATRGRAKTEERDHKLSPLSPKKATQVGTAREQISDDELGTCEKTPMKPLMRSPKKAPETIFGTAKMLDFSNSITVHRIVPRELSRSTMASPARRPPQSPCKESLRTSPMRGNLGRPLLQSPFKLSLPLKLVESDSNHILKTSQLQSPARRPPSPTKVAENGSPTRSGSGISIFRATPKEISLNLSRFATPKTLTKSPIRLGQMLPPKALENVPTYRSQGVTDSYESDKVSTFSGRLSSIMPRNVDPDHSPSESTAHDADTQLTLVGTETAASILFDQPDQAAEESMVTQSTTPPSSAPRYSTGIFALRDTDKNPFEDSDSEDELASNSPKYSCSPLNDFPSSPAIPSPFTTMDKTPRNAATQKVDSNDRSVRKGKVGFTPLARQLNDWMATGTGKPEEGISDLESISPTAFAPNPIPSANMEASVETCPADSTFFEDEMTVREEMQLGPGLSEDILIEEQNFSPIEVEDEDLALAHEADEMSLLETDQIQNSADGVEMLEQATYQTTEDGRTDDAMEGINTSESVPSEASQEYGDENAIPIDPALLSLPNLQAPSTPASTVPKRVLMERVFHTVSKVPLKAAAEESPMRASPIKRSVSVSRLPAQRPSSTLIRNNTVISYSPTKSASRTEPTPMEEDIITKEACVTPSKSDAAQWSTIGTPARTPRRDLNAALLKGAVVFVDVHTSEGADASALFTELLVQMGARCVKSWNWNGNGEDDIKIGITHVVFKDGGKRTLEKARETNGVVSCVGVGWVLDCEKENKWLPESPYSVDTTLVPRGGHRRRKSMEPRALANLNGALLPVASSARKYTSPTKELMKFEDTPATNKSRRRESVEWVRSPCSNPSGGDENMDDQIPMLSPVPATPLPEAISAYGEVGLYGDESPGGKTPYYLHREQLIQRTAPAKKHVGTDGGMGAGFLSGKKDETVMMRLMAARRKSLQWAPKVGSPLARSYE